MNSGFESPSWSEELLRLSARETAEEEREFLAMVTDLRGRCTPEVASVLMKTFSAEPDYETQECVLSTLLSAPRGVYVHAMLEDLPRLVHEAPEWADALVAIEVNNFPELIVQSFAGLQAGAQRSLVNVLSRADFQVSNPAAVETLARLESKEEASLVPVASQCRILGLNVFDGSSGYPVLASYTAQNQLKSYKNLDRGPATTNYSYDVSHRRYKTTRDGQTRYFVYLGDQIIEEYDWVAGTGLTLSKSFVYGNYIDEVLQMRDHVAGEDYYYHHDDLFNVVAISDGDGAMVERYQYEDFGKPTVLDANWVDQGWLASIVGNERLFQGREYDWYTGLYDYRARHMDPDSGRFLTRDPLGMWGDVLHLGERIYVPEQQSVEPGGPVWVVREWESG